MKVQVSLDGTNYSAFGINGIAMAVGKKTKLDVMNEGEISPGVFILSAIPMFIEKNLGEIRELGVKAKIAQ